MIYSHISVTGLSVAIAAALSGGALAQSSTPVFEEVLVTAEKRSESLQDLSQAITVLSGDDLDNRQIASFVDLSAIAPGVNIAKNEGFKTVITIRGVGNEANQNAIANPSVSYHLDGIYVASPFALQTDFLDLERIEVLRGPQGTLFGQNSTGGAINVITQAPSLDGTFGKADLTLGDYGLVKARAAYNLPLSDTLAVRASVISNKRDGFIENLTLGQDLDDANSMSARVRMLYEPSDDFRANFTAQYFDEDRNGSAQKGLLDTTPDARELRQNSPAEYELTSELYSAVLEWDFESFAVKSLTSYQNDSILVRRDNDRHDSSVDILPSQYDPETNKQTTVTQEVNLVSVDPLFGKLDWVAGFFYLNTEVEISILERLDFGRDGFDPFTRQDVLYDANCCDKGFISDSKPERDSASVYGQGTWNFNDDLRAVFGLRFTKDEVYSEVTNFYGAYGTDIIETSSEKVTGRLVIEHDFNESTMAYGSYTRGFKPGGSNLTYGKEDTIAQIVVLPTFEEEIVDAYEIGLKTDLADGRVRLNTAAFYYNYEGLQYQATDPEVFQGGVGNIPKSEIFGAELELSAFLSDSLILDVRIAWLDTEITGDHQALDNVKSESATNTLLASCGFVLFCDDIQQARALQIQNVNGNDLAKTPKFTGNVALNWNTEIASWGEVNSSLQYTYRGEFKHRIFNNDTTDVVPSYDVIDLVVGFRPNGKDWRVELVGKNLTDEAGINARFTDVFGVGATGDELIGPRQVMARFAMDF